MRSFFVCLILVTSFGCDGPIDCTMAAGVYAHEVSRNMGGYNISQSSTLQISKRGPGDYSYVLETTVIDQMYGSNPKYDRSAGSMSGEVLDGYKWAFSGGSLGQRGAYIEIPSGGWTSKPDFLRVAFPRNGGDAMKFKAQ